MFGTYQRLGVHVYEPDIAVVRAARRLITPKHRSSPEKKEERKVFYRQMLDHHRHERELCKEFSL